MIELHIPQLGENTKQSKDLVFSILSEKQPLSLIELSNIIKKQHNLNLTYHAVKKAVDDFVKKDLLIKEGKKYKINKQWLIQLKTHVDKLLTTYEKKEKVKTFESNMATEQYATYTFTKLIDCDNFWDDLLFYLAKHISQEEEHSFLVHTHYNWWFLINYGQEAKLHSHMLKKGFKTHFLIIGENSLNNWAKKIYQSLGVKSTIVKENISEESMTLNIIGNTVIQTYYPKEIITILRKIYKNYKNTQDIPIKEITELANKECEIKLNVFKNKEIASSLREKYLKKFIK